MSEINLEPEELFSVRAHFYAGAYETVLNESASVIADSDSLRQLTTCFQIRALQALDREIPHNLDLKLPPSAALTARDQSQLDNLQLRTALDHLCAALSYQRFGNIRQALTVLHNQPPSLDCIALRVQLYIDLSRFDLAQEEFKQLAKLDEDDVLSMITGVKLAACGYGDTAQAKDTVNDLIQRFGMTILLGEMKAVLAMRATQFSDALQALKQCRGLARNNGLALSSATLFNSIVCLDHLDGQFPKNDEIRSKLVQELKQFYPEHHYFSMERQVQESFV